MGWKGGIKLAFLVSFLFVHLFPYSSRELLPVAADNRGPFLLGKFPAYRLVKKGGEGGLVL